MTEVAQMVVASYLSCVTYDRMHLIARRSDETIKLYRYFRVVTLKLYTYSSSKI